MGTETEIILEKRKGDPIKENRRAIRVLVTYNATNFFLVEGKMAGLEFELMKAFEKHLNKGLPAEQKRHLIFISTPFENLLKDLNDGAGDIAAAGLTITPERSKSVAFSKPYRTNISEIVVRHKDAPPVADAEELVGETVYVVKGSSYYSHLQALNSRLKKEKKGSIKIVEADPNLVSEDLLQMVNAGVYKYAVVDSHIAELWAKVLDDIVEEPGAAITTGSQIAWAVRKNNTALLTSLNDFLKDYRQGTKLGNILFNRYYKKTKWITNPVNDSTMERLYDYQKSFIKYGKEYNIDWEMLAALGYQESKLDQSVKSKHGAVGVMQIKPTTAADKNVGIKGVAESSDKNIQAATKYLAFLRKRYFSDPAIEPIEQLAFTLAAYNAGPARITQMRNKAKKLGKDPNRWFFNVENITRKYASSEPVIYVANIMKYYLAFRSALDVADSRVRAADKLK